ncbi:MAG TPA: peptidoglycan binding domain-containing protein, partial [Chloroflexota bacterium]
MVLLLLLLLLLAMVGLSVAYQGHVLPGVRVAGVPVGGLPPEAAHARLAQQAGAIAAVRAELRADDAVWQPTLAELGLALEPSQATQDAYAVGRLGGLLGGLLVIARAPFESVDVTPAAVARPRVAAWVDGAAGQFDRPAQDARFE